jgi:predicted phage terminase large subunit-like protein
MIGGVRGKQALRPPLSFSERCLPRRTTSDGASGEPFACTLPQWAELALDPLRPAAHHRLLLSRLERVADGTLDRLMVVMPPGSAKSTYCSVLLPGWWLRRHPGHSIIAACHTEALAHSFGRRARALVAEHAAALGLGLAKDDRAAGRWSVEDGGSYFAAGVRGPIVGRRADLVLIDDPVKNHAEADSAAARESLWQWYQADLIPRLKPGGRIVLVMTRWHEDDLGGRVLGADDRWDVLRLPALAEEGDPLGRPPGAALWPEWEDAVLLNRKRHSVGERTWHAVFQQRPRPDSGTLFRPESIELRETAPECRGVVRAWDLAATEAAAGGDPDWTVGLKLGRHAAGICVLDVVRLRGNPLAVEQAIVATADADGRAVAIGLPQDPGQAGKQQVAHLRRLLGAYRVQASPEGGSKLTRAGPVSAQVEAGAVSAVRAPWTAALLDELRDFPHGRHDDQVDALARAFAMLEGSQSEARRLRVNLLGR